MIIDGCTGWDRGVDTEIRVANDPMGECEKWRTLITE